MISAARCGDGPRATMRPRDALQEAVAKTEHAQTSLFFERATLMGFTTIRRGRLDYATGTGVIVTTGAGPSFESRFIRGVEYQSVPGRGPLARALGRTLHLDGKRWLKTDCTATERGRPGSQRHLSLRRGPARNTDATPPVQQRLPTGWPGCGSRRPGNRVPRRDLRSGGAGKRPGGSHGLD